MANLKDRKPFTNCRLSYKLAVAFPKRKPTDPPPEMRKVTEQDKEIVTEWLNKLADDLIEGEFPLPMDPLFEIAAERYGRGVTRSDIYALRQARRHLFFDAATQCVGVEDNT